MRLFLVLALLSLVAAAPSPLSEEIIVDIFDSSAEAEPSGPSVIPDSQFAENHEEIFEIEEMTSFESKRTYSEEDEADEVRTEVVEEEEIEETSERTFEYQRRRRSPAEEDSEDAEKETETMTELPEVTSTTEISENGKSEADASFAEVTPVEAKEERTRRDLEEGQMESTSQGEKMQGSAERGNSRAMVLASGEHLTDGHIVREKLMEEDKAADDKARTAMEKEHMAAIHTMETIVKNMQEDTT